MWYSLFTCQCTSNTTMVSTPSARQRRSISLCPAIAASRQPKFGPGNSDKYIDGTCVILAASASLPMARAFVAVRESHRLLRARVYAQCEDVRPRVMPHGVEVHLRHG